MDLKHPEFDETAADEFVIGDLRSTSVTAGVLQKIDAVYQLAADMGESAGYIFTGEHDAAVMHNSATINLNMLHEESQGCRCKAPSVLLLVFGLHVPGTQSVAGP